MELVHTDLPKSPRICRIRRDSSGIPERRSSCRSVTLRFYPPIRPPPGSRAIDLVQRPRDSREPSASPLSLCWSEGPLSTPPRLFVDAPQSLSWAQVEIGCIASRRLLMEPEHPMLQKRFVSSRLIHRSRPSCSRGAKGFVHTPVTDLGDVPTKWWIAVSSKGSIDLLLCWTEGSLSTLERRLGRPTRTHTVAAARWAATLLAHSDC